LDQLQQLLNHQNQLQVDHFIIIIIIIGIESKNFYIHLFRKKEKEKRKKEERKKTVLNDLEKTQGRK